MSIDLNGIGSGQVNTRRTAADQPVTPPLPASPDPAAPRVAAPQGDKVSLSSMQQLKQQLDQVPEVDDSRVEQIKAALADGSYKVDAEKLAQKMLDMDESIFG
ncbi:flagellar biosynthesis anti-sigma factor FlgM [Marinobacter sp. X15-166B]|uniref:flagellar biosynthesis anti-sigma factor FlgM n=1 Tax=Marinobacter sp. X15-166B TaxID=1897620 RepID=UPI00085C9004|nr:flagellar biosynthesis anti-sigma factor FlgM [Marinobacter sp. X15-166B]OEY67413.1 flagellar biosynthesis anti-sigma factor FlgM [Marinobacter sp. X15-166B]